MDMVYDPNTASKNLELLKGNFEEELTKLENMGRDLLKAHPRYKDQATQMMEVACAKRAECNENLFSLALGADFQAGKSTTVNAMADGREICPRGNGGGGIRTSACAVQIRCALDDNSQSTIQWKTDAQLNQDVRYWTDDILSLDKAEKMSKAEEKAWDDIVAKLGDGELSSDNAVLDRIQQALLFMSYYNDTDIQKRRDRTNFSADEILSFLAFPEDNPTRWTNIFQRIKRKELNTLSAACESIRKQFRSENAMYLFIEIVNFATPSEYLKVMGITVVDTPGLNMSDNDTRVALRCMENAAAIFYLFEGEKQLGDADKAALQQIKQAGLNGKTFFGINFRRPPATLTSIANTILADLNTLGYNEKHQQNLLYYNAFLAQRAKQGRLILSGTLDEAGKEKLMSEARESGCEATTVEQAWLETTDSVMNRVKAEGYRDFYAKGLCEESIEQAYGASRWEETMNAILNYVLKNRGRILLNDRIAKPVNDQMMALEQALKVDELNAKSTAEELDAQYKQAQRRYQEFQRACDSKIREWIADDWDTLIAEDCYRNVYEKCAEEAAKRAAPKIKKEQTFLANVGTLLFRSSKLEKKCNAIISESIAVVSEPLMINWRNSFEDSTIYRNTVYASVKNLHRAIMDVWSQKGMDDNGILQNLRSQLEMKFPQGKFSDDIVNVQLSKSALKAILGQNVQVSGTLLDVLMGMLGGYGAGVGLWIIYLYILPADFIIPGIAEIIGVIMLAVMAIVTAFSSEQRKEKALKKMTSDLQRELDKALHDSKNREKIIRKMAEGTDDAPGLSIYRLFYRNAFKDAVDGCSKLLEKQAKDAHESAIQGDAERKRIAEEAKDIRENVLAPLQQRMKDLQEKVREICPETAIIEEQA